MAGVSRIMWLGAEHPWGTCFLTGGYDGKVLTWQLAGGGVEDYKFWTPMGPTSS